MPNRKRTKWKTRTNQPKTSAAGNIIWLSLQTTLFNKISKPKQAKIGAEGNIIWLSLSNGII